MVLSTVCACVGLHGMGFDRIIGFGITGGKFVVADQKIAGRNKAHCIYIQNKAES